MNEPDSLFTPREITCLRCGYDLRGTILSTQSTCPECAGRFRVSVTQPSSRVAGWFAAMLPSAMTVGAGLFYIVGGPLDLPFDRTMAVLITIPAALFILAAMLYWRGMLRARPVVQWPVAAAIWIGWLLYWRWFLYGP